MLRIEIKNLTAKRIPPVRLLKKAIREALKSGRVTDAALNVVFMTDGDIRKLNRRFKKTDSPTDVLAFGPGRAAGPDKKRKPSFLGDIAVSVDAAQRQAKEFNSSRKKELYLYVIHGVLHLLGRDDRSRKDFKRMERSQKRILESIWNDIA